MKVILITLLILLHAISVFAQKKEGLANKNGLRIEVGRALLGPGDLRGVHVGGMWSQRLTNKLDVEFGAGYVNFPNSKRGGLEQMTSGAILESFVKYNIINIDWIKIYAGTGPFFEILRFDYETGSETGFYSASQDFRLGKNSSGGYSTNEFGINFTIGAKFRIFDQYYINVSPVAQIISSHYNASLRMGLEVRF